MPNTEVFIGSTVQVSSGGIRTAPHGGPPMVSIITVAYEAASTLEATIASVREQSSSDYEFIIIDGGSGDASVEILRKHEPHIDRWLSEPDRGIYDAMNKGAALASGSYLAFLNADDRYLPNTIERVVHCIRERQPDVVYGNMVKARDLGSGEMQRLERPRLEDMPRTMGVFHPATFVKKSAFEALGGYDTRYKLAADYELCLKLWQGGYRFEYIDHALAIFSMEGLSNAGCGTYAEAVDIQTRHQTGHADATRLLLRKCKRKQQLRKILFGLARASGTEGWLKRLIERRWR